MSLFSLSSSDVFMMQAGSNPKISGWRTWDSVYGHASFYSGTALGLSDRIFCPIRLHCGEPLAVKRKTAKSVNIFCCTPNSMPGKKGLDVGSAIFLNFLSRNNGSWTQHSKVEAGFASVAKNSTAVVNESLGDKLREIPSKRMESASGQMTSSTSILSPPSLNEGGLPVNLTAGVGVTAAVFMMAVLGFMAKPRTDGGSVSDLIRRGQLRSDRGGDATILTFDDPFNNSLVKMGKHNPIVRMCGKMFRLAPVTLTDEKVVEHKIRRIRAYKWKRPIMFLNEGDPVPEGIDPEEVRWIPSNHPFATTSNSIDEDLAQKNVYQTRGVPYCVRAEHEALCKKVFETTEGVPDFQLPGSESSRAQAWKTLDRTSETAGSLLETMANDQILLWCLVNK